MTDLEQLAKRVKSFLEEHTECSFLRRDRPAPVDLEAATSQWTFSIQGTDTKGDYNSKSLIEYSNQESDPNPDNEFKREFYEPMEALRKLYSHLELVHENGSHFDKPLF